MIDKALQFAVKAHDGQYRKGKVKIPYIVHPIEVMKCLAQWRIDNEDILVSALLHDVVEDTDYTQEQIAQMFNPKVALIVQELTCYDDVKGESKQERKKRKASYLASFHNTTVEALLVKLSDRICNSWDYVRDGSHEYADQYFNKAGSLFEAFNNRIEEIQSLIGEKSYLKIQKAIYEFSLRNKK